MEWNALPPPIVKSGCELMGKWLFVQYDKNGCLYTSTCTTNQVCVLGFCLVRLVVGASIGGLQSQSQIQSKTRDAGGASKMTRAKKLFRTWQEIGVIVSRKRGKEAKGRTRFHVCHAVRLCIGSLAKTQRGPRAALGRARAHAAPPLFALLGSDEIVCP